MDMRVYYRKIQEKEEELRDDAVVVISLETPDGGKPGVPTEVSRRNAAIMLVEGRAELASEAVATKFRQAVKDAKAGADEAEAGRKMEFTLIPAGDAKRGSIRPPKV